MSNTRITLVSPDQRFEATYDMGFDATSVHVADVGDGPLWAPISTIALDHADALEHLIDLLHQGWTRLIPAESDTAKR